MVISNVNILLQLGSVGLKLKISHARTETPFKKITVDICRLCLCNSVKVLPYFSKRWTLFPPSDTDNLYPTRIPYEESSIFSRVNISKPALCSFPKYKVCFLTSIKVHVYVSL